MSRAHSAPATPRTPHPTEAMQNPGTKTTGDHLANARHCAASAADCLRIASARADFVEHAQDDADPKPARLAAADVSEFIGRAVEELGATLSSLRQWEASDGVLREVDIYRERARTLADVWKNDRSAEAAAALSPLLFSLAGSLSRLCSACLTPSVSANRPR